MQVCRTCGKSKDFSCFYGSKRYKSGYDSECKECKLNHQKKRTKIAKNVLHFTKEEYLTKEEVCTYLGIGLSSVAKLHDRVPPVKDGKRNLYKREEIDNLFNDNMVES